MKPDYFITHNGLPSILRSRHLIMQTAKKSDRVLANQQQQIHPPSKSKRIIGTGANQQAHVTMPCDGEKNARNRLIKESLRSSKATKDLINAQIVRNQTLSTPKCASADSSTYNRDLKR